MLGGFVQELLRLEGRFLYIIADDFEGDERRTSG